MSGRAQLFNYSTETQIVKVNVNVKIPITRLHAQKGGKREKEKGERIKYINKSINLFISKPIYSIPIINIGTRSTIQLFNKNHPVQRLHDLTV